MSLWKASLFAFLVDAGYSTNRGESFVKGYACAMQKREHIKSLYHERTILKAVGADESDLRRDSIVGQVKSL